jgi:hypothetical protein
MPPAQGRTVTMIAQPRAPQKLLAHLDWMNRQFGEEGDLTPNWSTRSDGTSGRKLADGLRGGPLIRVKF